MHLVIQRTDLVTSLKRTQSALEKSGAGSEWRSSVLVDARGDVITFHTSNGFLRVANIMPGQIVKNGWMLLSHKKLSDWASSLPEGRIELTVDKDFKVLAKSLEAKRKFSGASLEPEIFPSLLTEETPAPIFKVSAKILQQAIDETIFLTQKDYIDGILIAPGADKDFQMAGMGRYGLSVANAWFTEVTEKRELLLPRALTEAIKALPSDEEEILIATTEQRAIITRGGTTISCDLLANPLPPWRTVFSNRTVNKRFKVSAETLHDSVKAVSVASDTVEGDERFVQINIAYEGDSCRISTKKSASQEGEDDFTVLEPSGEACDLAVNGQYLMQALRAFSGHDIFLMFERDGVSQQFTLENEYLSVTLTPLSDVKGK